MALAGVIGWAVNHLVKDYVLREAEKSLEIKLGEKKKEIDADLSKIRNEISRERGLRRIITAVDIWKSNRDMAIKLTRLALEEEGLTPADKLLANSNLGYYLAESFRHTNIPQEAEEAKQLASEANNSYDIRKDGYDRPEWVHNWAYVERVKAKTKDEKEALRKTIDRLVGREDLKSIRVYLQEELSALDSDLAS